MRWDDLKADRDDEGRLPGLAGSTGVVRRFDAPEAMGVRFHEVRAKSALNRVPKKSRMPFRWTVNAFRGCAHACSFCMDGHTPVLMADGRTRRLAELEVGDAVYGTARDGLYRRYELTRVLAHWSSVQDTFRIVLADGTELLASGEHRFWTRRGKWKHVIGSEWGPMQRPHLTLNDHLLGTGQFAAGPDSDAPQYRRGYLCGMVRGDGTIGSYSYSRPGRNVDDHHRFGLALTDLDGLRRAREYLTDFEIDTDEFQYTAGNDRHRPARAIRTSKRSNVDAIRDLIEWPGRASDLWCAGFLAGIFDAEGSNSAVVRIANGDDEIIDWICWSLRRLDFKFVVERHPGHVGVVRLRGGLREVLRFMHRVDPAISRKRSLEGIALKSDADLRIASIEPIGKRRLYDITTGTGDFIANGVVSHNCFARPTHTYLDLNAGPDWEREIVVKVNVPELLRAELRRPSWKRELVAFGTNTDPYQWVEGKYELMPPMLEALAEAETPVSVLTRSPLALRDLELYKRIGEVAEVSVNFSVPTLEEKAWRASEPHTPNPRKRIEAVARLREAGIDSGVLIAPLMPGINDHPEQVEEIVRLCEQAGASFINGIALHLRPGVKEVFMGWLRAQRPDLVERYERLYGDRAYLAPADRDQVEAGLRTAGRWPGGRPGEPYPRRRRPALQPRQSSLF